MKVSEVSFGGAWIIEAARHSDDRGWFQEWYKKSELDKHINFNFIPVQANISKSAAGVIRGIHYSIAPQGQSKLVTVMSGSVDDYIIDLHPSSSTFGRWERVHLSSDNGCMVLLSPHMGHAFQSLVNDTVVSYIVTAEFNPSVEMAISPFCPDINIEWSYPGEAIVSEKDRIAPGLLAQQRAGNLPSA